MKNLHDIATSKGTDKSMRNRTENRSYLDTYKIYFEEWIEKDLTLLEIGVRYGNSLRTWEDYFPAAKIYGIDVDISSSKHASSRSTVIIGDGTKEETYSKELDGITYDIIIDDGSHKNLDIIESYNILWPKLNSGGIYIIEDLYNSYGSSNRQILGTSSGIPENNREQIESFFNKIANDVNTPSKNTLFIHFWDSICVIGKVSV